MGKSSVLFRHAVSVFAVALTGVAASTGVCQVPGKSLIPQRAAIATGPVRRNPANPRYFTDGSGRAIYLTGSHTWANLMDRGQLNRPGVKFNYTAYIKWMVDHNFNFMRLWTAELPNAGGPDYIIQRAIL